MDDGREKGWYQYTHVGRGGAAKREGPLASCHRVSPPKQSEDKLDSQELPLSLVAELVDETRRSSGGCTHAAGIR